MLCIRSQQNNPAFNIATEEYLLKQNNADFFYLYINRPSIIVGKHQNTLSEINIEQVRAQNIDVIRRLSGGGAVYHDGGNLNFTFIRKIKEGEKKIDFSGYTQPIIEVLQSIGVDAKFEGRNDLTIDGKKFSGNAEHTFGKRILHHGTLLFNSELEALGAALKVNKQKFKDKAVQSVRSRVTNISDHLTKSIDITEFESLIFSHIQKIYPEAKMYTLTDTDVAAINNLVEKKYSQWAWNFGSSPNYDFSKQLRTKGGSVELKLSVKQGIIKEVKLFGDFFTYKDLDILEDALKDIPHEKEHILQKLETVGVENYLRHIDADDLIEAFF